MNVLGGSLGGYLGWLLGWFLKALGGNLVGLVRMKPSRVATTTIFLEQYFMDRTPSMFLGANHPNEQDDHPDLGSFILVLGGFARFPS